MVMRTMKLQRNLNNYLNIVLCFVFLCLVSANVYAGTKWEVATVFLGSREAEDYQLDVEKNIRELKAIKKNPALIVSTFRPPVGSNLNLRELQTFLTRAFSDPQSKKIMIIYGHGDGPSGLRDLKTLELQKILKGLKWPLDILWLDACFQSNLEFLFQLRSSSLLTIASEEAEFSSGLPFSSLAELPQANSTEEAALNLAKNFISSYSYLNEGEQRDSVGQSSATISVIDNRELDSFTDFFKKIPNIISLLTPYEQKVLQIKMQKKYSMDNPSLIDLGHLLIELRSLNKNSASDKELTELIRLLNIESIKKLKTNIRLKITAPEANALMVFGFNNWENGTKEEYLENVLFSDIIKTNLFISGPNNQKWPVRKFEYMSTFITPFAPGINSFQYYFLDSTGKKKLSNIQSLSRSQDVIEINISEKKKGQFLLYTAYTQRIGVQAERYTGVNISLQKTVPSIDYFEMDFNKKVKWLEL